MKRNLLILLMFLMANCAGAQRHEGTSAQRPSTVDSASPVEPPSMPQRLEPVEALLEARGFEGAFVVRRERGSDVDVMAANLELAARQVGPCSTFKIPNTLIGLETGVIADGSFTLPWDGQERSIPQWNRDQDLASALEFSVVWFYQEIARRIGYDRMSAFVQQLDYGNAHIGGPELIDRFWLDGPLLISPIEQVRFLARLTGGGLEISPRSVEILRQVMPRRERNGAMVVAKTGTCMDEEHSHAWLVGWVEREDREPTSHFALLLAGEREQAQSFIDSRWDLAFESLEISEAL